jgi:hypothetical protein
MRDREKRRWKHRVAIVAYPQNPWAGAVMQAIDSKLESWCPPTRIERATRGLGIRPEQFLKRSVYQMVSPF